jgi:hypothetical protein
VFLIIFLIIGAVVIASSLGKKTDNKINTPKKEKDEPELISINSTKGKKRDKKIAM